jgi:hypothetical protein
MFKFENSGINTSFLKPVSEGDVTVLVDDSAISHKRNSVYYNKDHALNRWVCKIYICNLLDFLFWYIFYFEK